MMTNETLTLEMKFFEKYFDIQNHLLRACACIVAYRVPSTNTLSLNVLYIFRMIH